jgi:hypothetical protein
MARVFISHSSRDNEAAARMKTWLESQGFENAFLDKDKSTGIPPGADWEKTLYREVERSQAVVILQTPSWLASKWCFAEFTQARALGKTIFPVIETPSDGARISSDIQTLDLTGDREGELRRLSRELARIALDAQGGFTWEAHRAPFPGLLAFQGEDAAVFFGRDDDIRRLIERLEARRAQGGIKLIAVLGSSGSGKSSLLRAGVIPRLKRAGRNWVVVPPIRPRISPVDELARALAVSLGLGSNWRKLQSDLRGPNPGIALNDLGNDLRVKAGAAEAQILIPIDQAEELFGVADPDDAQRFLEILSHTLCENLPFLAVMALRSDFLGQLQSAAALTARFEQFSLGPMPLARIPQIIEGPAGVAGVHVEDAFVQQAAHDAETEDALPLLAFALRALLDRSPQKILTLDGYKALGDEKAGLSPLENAVRKAADEVLAEAKPDDKELAALREAFVPAMVRVNDQGEYVRRPARWDEMPAKSRALLERLAEARLLIMRQEGDARTVEAAHEALLRKWPLLRSWLDAAREFLIGKQQLEQDLRDWNQAAEADKASALLTGLKLNRARGWLVEYPNQLTQPERAFIRTSVQSVEAEESRKARTRRNVTRGSIAAAGVLAVVAGWALWENHKAQESEQQARAAQNAATQALQVSEKNYKLALDQAVGNLRVLEDYYDKGNLPTAILRTLIERSQATVLGLPEEGDPDDITVARIQILELISVMEVSVGDSKAIQTALQRNTLADRLKDKDPSNPQWKAIWATAHGGLGIMQYWLCDCVEGAQQARIAADATAQLIKDEPDDYNLHQSLLTDYETEGDALRALGDIDGADDAYHNLLQDSAAAVDRYQDKAWWLSELAYAKERLGDILLLRDNPTAAAQYYSEYSAIAQQLVTEHPQETEYLSGLVQSEQRTGDDWLARGDSAKARTAYSDYRTHALDLTTRDPENFRFRDFYTSAYQRLGAVELEDHNNDEALNAFRKYLELAEKMYNDYPSNNTALYDVSNAHLTIGDALVEQHDLPGALQEYMSSEDLATKLNETKCRNGTWQRLMAIAYQRVATTLEAQGRNQEALQRFSKCAAVPVKATVWAPANRWPRNPVVFCNEEIEKLRIAIPKGEAGPKD